MPERLKAQLDLLRTQLLADKKKAAIMGVLVVVLLVVVSRLLLSSGPEQTTAASPALAVTAVAAQATAPAELPSSAAAGSATRTDTSAPRSSIDELRAEESSAAHRAVSVTGMPRDLARDLFTTKEWNKFMPAVLAGAEASSGEAGRRRSVGMWGRLRKSWSEYNRDQQELTEAFHRDLESLQLHSTMTGAEPLAHISGRLVRAGDDILGFSVVRIADREVVVARGGLTASLTMK